ncbi:MAG: sigma-70 family RNA polymerase sigma factor [Flavobacteriales bacterium]|nr:sigma-70 family RNA polymerase sigma factor [Flavobacteriales bacterium]
MLSVFKKKITTQSEKKLIELSKRDSRYFAPLYEKYHEQIFRFVYKRMNDLDDSSDITSQVFLKALVHIKNYKHTGVPFVAWLYRIAINEINQYYRDKKKKRTINISHVDVRNIVNDAEVKYNFEMQDKMIASLNELDDLKILLLELRYFEKRSFKEIASILNITESNAKIKVYRLLEELQKKLI